MLPGGVYAVWAQRTLPARANSISYVIATHFDRLDCAANARCI